VIFGNNGKLCNSSRASREFSMLAQSAFASPIDWGDTDGCGIPHLKATRCCDGDEDEKTGCGMSTYALGLLGGVTPEESQIIATTVRAFLQGYELELGRDVVIVDAHSIGGRDGRSAFAALYWGSTTHADAALVASLVRLSLPIIPVTRPGEQFTDVIPPVLQGFNGVSTDPRDATYATLCTALLECVGLLRLQRRVFLSYRRVESQEAAIQLHDAFSARGFDAFLDTHDIRQGDQFQDALWHRLCDSDVMVMLDTPGYFESKWTRQEIGRARAKDIAILRVVWPDHTPSRHTDLSESIYLAGGDLLAPKGPLIEAMVTRIILEVESLRSRSIAARHMLMAGRLRAEVVKIGGAFIGIGAHRAMRLRLEGGRELLAYPMVGVPTAETLHDVASKAIQAGFGEPPILVYDPTGIRAQWETHLKWLDDNIASVRAIKIIEAGFALVSWEN
jgi:hypothetical protein